MSSIIKNRGFWVILVTVMACVAITVTIGFVAQPTKSSFSPNENEQTSSNAIPTAYGGTDITVSGVVVGKRWAETDINTHITSLVATASKGYTFSHWTRTKSSTTIKYSGRTSFSCPEALQSSFNPVFVANSRVKMVSSLADIQNNYASSSYDILMLTGDIDAAGAALTTIDKTFSKVLDGAGYTIRNLTSSSNGLLFKTLTGVIKNLTLEAGNLTATSTDCGGFIQTINSNGVISNCVMRSDIKSTMDSSCVGAFAAFATGSTSTTDTCFIDGCTNAGSVMGYYVGAMICDNKYATCSLIDNVMEGSMTSLLGLSK